MAKKVTYVIVTAPGYGYLIKQVGKPDAFGSHDEYYGGDGRWWFSSVYARRYLYVWTAKIALHFALKPLRKRRREEAKVEAAAKLILEHNEEVKYDISP